MKLILLQDVKGTGKAGQIIEASDGYARNFLLPRKLATVANDGNLAAAQQAQSALTHRKKVEREQAVENAKKLDGSTVRLTAKAGENGKLFGAITSKEIAAELSKIAGFAVDKKQVELSESIKQLGDYEIVVRVYADTTCKITAQIVAQ